VITPDEPRTGFWGELTKAERTALRAVGYWSTFKPDTSILIEHDATDHIAVIWAGFAKVWSRLGTHRAVVLGIREPGDIVGEMVSIRGGRRSATITALDEVVALVIDADSFTAFLARSPHASVVLQRVLVDRLRAGDRSRVSAATMNVSQRLAGLLLQLERRYGVEAEDGGTRIALALPQKDLAALIGASPRAVTREIERWRQRDIITTGRRWLAIRQPAALRRIAGPNAPPVARAYLPGAI
jgi:CRP-like cAMP-binding protein